MILAAGLIQKNAMYSSLHPSLLMVFKLFPFLFVKKIFFTGSKAAMFSVSFRITFSKKELGQRSGVELSNAEPSCAGIERKREGHRKPT